MFASFIVLHGIRICPLKVAGLRSPHFVITHLFMNLFSTKSTVAI